MTDYSNRSDLRNPATRQVAFTGQTYGTATQQAQAQQAVAPGTAPGTVAAQQMAAQQAPAPRPGAKPLSRPTERPAEPITAGADFGAGPNSAQAGIMPRIVPVDETLEQLRVLYQMFPNPDLADMISKYTESQYQ
jgi:hypothetical protein